MKLVNFLFFILVIPIIFQGCGSTDHIRPVLATDTNYQKDLSMEVRSWDEEEGEWKKEQPVDGMGVIPFAPGYKIKIDPPGKADMITVLSCHREWKTPNPKKQGGWFSNGYYEFEIWPTLEHEVEKTCPFDAGVYEKDKGRHAWGLLVINSKREKLGATVKCNGETKVFGGTSVCQSKKGLIQSIHFDRRVRATQVSGCNIREPFDKRNWVFIMPEGECTIFFIDEKNHEVFHKVVLFGYDVIPIRGVE